MISFSQVGFLKSEVLHIKQQNLCSRTLQYLCTLQQH